MYHASSFFWDLVLKVLFHCLLQAPRFIHASSCFHEQNVTQKHKILWYAASPMLNIQLCGKEMCYCPVSVSEPLDYIICHTSISLSGLASCGLFQSKDDSFRAILFVVFNNVGDWTVKNAAQPGYCMQAANLVMLHLGKGWAWNLIVFCQHVLAYLLFFQRFPERVISYHILS